jgi:hypothetical protein
MVPGGAAALSDETFASHMLTHQLVTYLFGLT